MMFADFLTSFTAQFVALDIIGAVPIYFSLTHAMEEKERNSMVNKSMFVALIVAIVFMLIGLKVFKFMGIEIFDFKMAGGLVLLLIALADLAGSHDAEKNSSGSTGIVPIAVPLISGPGVLTTLILQVSTVGYLITGLGLLCNYTLAWIILRHSSAVKKVIGKDGTVVVSKIAALLLAAYSLAMLRSGIFEAINFWRSN